MVIQNSNVAFSANTVKTTAKYESVSYSGWSGSAVSAGFLNAIPTATEGAQTDEKTDAVETGKTTADSTEDKKTYRYSQARNEELYRAMSSENTVNSLFEAVDEGNGDSFETTLPDEKKVEYVSLKNILKTMSDRLTTRRMTARELFERLFLQMKERLSEITGSGEMQNLEGKQFATATGAKYKEQYVNMEVVKFERTEECTSFTSTGTAVTADGRTIDFETGFTSTRSFTQSTTVTFDYRDIYMMDPLVVNLSQETAEVSDQTFMFDLDCDGEEDNISLLSKACGFLALDRNGDGIINDGSELFGATTGDGFKELAVFDLDKNGWIDENDEIFNHLKIWKRCEDGSNELVGLGVAGIGAIYLGNVETDMTMWSEYGQVTGAVRQTGVYLNEDGTVGTIQHVDLAKIA